MKKLASVCAGLLLLLSTSVFAEENAASALEHAKQAVVHGKAGHTPMLVDHAKAALEDALSASIVAKGVSKNHIEAGSKELQEAIDLGTLGHVGKATTHAEAAVEHLKAGNK
ncbi:small metal-binding protein SmbP [Methylobacter sp.]|uniref:small metal-binding protein SmbP n=1 Tax=Methylobacter sp. TaxID=2051955 RepID=UPI002FDD5E55